MSSASRLSCESTSSSHPGLVWLHCSNSAATGPTTFSLAFPTHPATFHFPKGPSSGQETPSLHLVAHWSPQMEYKLDRGDLLEAALTWTWSLATFAAF